MGYDDVSRVRVRYSVLVNYVSRLIRFGASIVTSIIIARSLSVEEYGLLGLLLSIYNILLYAYAIWDWWMYRFYARGRVEYASAALFLSLVYMPLSMLIYVVIGYYYYLILGFGLTYFLAASILLAIGGLQYYYQYISRASRPFIIGYAFTVGELFRLAALYVLVYVYGMGLLGVIYSLMASRVAVVFSYHYFLRRESVYMPRPMMLRREIIVFFKNAFVPIVAFAANFLLNMERPLIVVFSGTTAYAAYITVSYIPRNIMQGSRFAFTAGLTAALLKKPRARDIVDTLRIALAVATLQLAVMSVFSRPILMVFNPVYLSAALLFVLYNAEAYVMTIANIFLSVLTGTDKSDLSVNGAGLVRSNVFFVAAANLLRNLAALAAGTAGMLYLLGAVGARDPVLVVLPYPLGWLVTGMALAAYSYRRARGEIEFSVPWREAFAAALASLAVALYGLVVGAYSMGYGGFWYTLFYLVVHGSASLMIFVAVMAAASPWTRRAIYYVLGRVSARLPWRH